MAFWLLSQNPEITIEELMELFQVLISQQRVIILGRSGIRKAYETGRGSIIIRAKVKLNRSQMVKKSLLLLNCLIK